MLVLEEDEKTRNLFELMIFQPVHGYELYYTVCREDARCRLSVLSLGLVGETTGVTLTSVEESVLGRGHEFMHEREHEGMLAVLASWTARTERRGD